MDRRGRRGWVFVQVDIQRLQERLVDSATLFSRFLSPIFHDELLHFWRTWIVDPSMAFTRDPIERLAAVSGYE
ncbi:hypothetical protein JF55_03605 [Pseudomonas sp. 1-7]|nr:hypothetical protein JF55_03605 [Pseudomonas sp. 1-7]